MHSQAVVGLPALPTTRYSQPLRVLVEKKEEIFEDLVEK